MELISIERRDLGGDQIDTVDARELWEFLESRQEFANWIKNRIAKYGFVEDIDFTVFDKFIKNPSGGRPTSVYAISVSMAKELAMVENNEKGRQARQYFIECERRAKTVVPVEALLADPAAMLAIVGGYAKKVVALESTVAYQSATLTKLTPKAEMADQFLECKNTFLISNAAKMLVVRQKDLFEWLALNRWIFKRSGCNNWLPYADRIESGDLVSKPTLMGIEQTRVTARGMSTLSRFTDSIRGIDMGWDDPLWQPFMYDRESTKRVVEAVFGG